MKRPVVIGVVGGRSPHRGRSRHRVRGRLERRAHTGKAGSKPTTTTHEAALQVGLGRLRRRRSRTRAPNRRRSTARSRPTRRTPTNRCRFPPGSPATITSCTWSASNGGELEAAGTITNTAGEDDVWLITAVWLQRNQTQDEDIDLQSDVIDLGVGQSKPWHLSISASSAPPDLSCALEIE